MIWYPYYAINGQLSDSSVVISIGWLTKSLSHPYHIRTIANITIDKDDLVTHPYHTGIMLLSYMNCFLSHPYAIEILYMYLFHCNEVSWGSSRLKSAAIRLFVQRNILTTKKTPELHITVPFVNGIRFPWQRASNVDSSSMTWRHLIIRSKLRLCSANHRPGYWSNLPCDWPSTAWAYFEQETENGPR